MTNGFYFPSYSLVHCKKHVLKSAFTSARCDQCHINNVWNMRNILGTCDTILYVIHIEYRMVSRVFRVPFRGGVAPEKGILNMSDIILYVFCIMAANQLCLF